MNVPDIRNLQKSQLSEKYFNNHYPEYAQYIKQTYSGEEWKDALYLDQNGLTSVPVCSVCGKKLRLISIYKGYPKCCSPQCSGRSDKWKKFESTMQSRYGCVHALQNDDCKNKATETSLHRYGVINYSKTDECRKKVHKTFVDRYGENYTNIFAAKGTATRQKNRINNSSIPNQIGYDENGDWILTCNQNCPGCNDHTFTIRSGTYFDRMKCGVDLCTKKYPVDPNRTKDTYLEKFIKDILDELRIEYESNRRDIIPPKELDIYIPSKQLAIVCNGVYWHSKYDQEYHITKRKQCAGEGIQLLTIWEDWIRKKPEIVKSVIYSKLGVYQYHIPARKCEIKLVDAKEFEKFLNNNHIQGVCNSPIRIGLSFNGELVAVMGFCKKRGCMGNGRKDGEYELTRFCSKLHTQVIGGADRLFKYFIHNFDSHSVYSFSSNDISNGNLYVKLGFKQGESTYNYWYIDMSTLQRYHRTSFTKSRIVQLGWKEKVSDDWTEFQVTKEHGFCRIYDTGVVKWIYELK